MEINVVEKQKNKMIVEIKGEDHTFCNALVKELWEDKDVKNAAYNIDHPAVSSPVVVIETSGKEPKKVLIDAAKRLKKDVTKFKGLAKKELK